jgi:hypothetical protein
VRKKSGSESQKSATEKPTENGTKSPVVRKKSGSESPALRKKSGSESPALRKKSGSENPTEKAEKSPATRKKTVIVNEYDNTAKSPATKNKSDIGQKIKSVKSFMTKGSKSGESNTKSSMFTSVPECDEEENVMKISAPVMISTTAQQTAESVKMASGKEHQLGSGNE